jgi:hypothetical protein
MNATRRFRLRLAVPIAAVAMLLTATPAGAQTTIGLANGGTLCPGSYDLVQMAATTASYSVPAGGGTITDWSTTSSVNTGSAGLLVWRPTATPGTYTLVAAIAAVPMNVGLNSFHLTTPIPVQAGDVLGLHTDGLVDCAAPGGGPDTIGYETAPTVAPGADESFVTDPVTLTLDIAATVEAPSTGNGHPNCSDRPGTDERDKCDQHDNKPQNDRGVSSDETTGATTSNQ